MSTTSDLPKWLRMVADSDAASSYTNRAEHMRAAAARLDELERENARLKSMVEAVTNACAALLPLEKETGTIEADCWVAVAPGVNIPINTPGVEYKFSDGDVTRDGMKALQFHDRLIAYRFVQTARAALAGSGEK
jgi:hypothetical protein